MNFTLVLHLKARFRQIAVMLLMSQVCCMYRCCDYHGQLITCGFGQREASGYMVVQAASAWRTFDLRPAALENREPFGKSKSHFDLSSMYHVWDHSPGARYPRMKSSEP